MQPTRRARLESVIQEELSRIVPREIKDPRVPSITFTAVQVSPDAGTATIFVSLLGGGQNLPEEEAKRKIKDCLAGLASASGFLRRHLASILNIRSVPLLVFREDKGFENAIRVHELLKKISEPSS